MDEKRLAVLRQHCDEVIARGFLTDHILGESDVDFLFSYIDAQVERIKALEGEIGHLHRRQHPSDAPSEVRARTASAIARELRFKQHDAARYHEIEPHDILEAEVKAYGVAIDICRALGATL